jgi:hypothetical protein
MKAVYPLLVGMKIVEAVMITHNQENNNARADPKRKTEHIYNCVDFISRHHSPRDQEIVLYHMKID